jgi:diguanylate cyclase
VNPTAVELEALFGALPDAVLTADALGKVQFLNHSAEQLTGRFGARALGRPMSEVLPLEIENGGTALESPAHVCQRTGSSVGPFEARLTGTGGWPRVLEVTASPIREADGPISGAILLARDVTRARLITRQLSHQATHDSLTGLVNRAEFERRLVHALLSASRDGARHTLGFLDLDGFKRVNDLCGHLAGDRLLQELSKQMHGFMRARDTLARLGGDEFGILLEHCGTAEAERIATQIRRAINDHRTTCDGTLHCLGASVGLVPLGDGSASPEQLLRAADSACYQAKHEGGNRIHLGGVWAEPSTAGK